MTTVCVFCGSNRGANPSFVDAAERFGKGLAARGGSLVYGGASVGLMGVVADSVIGAGGTATGVITQALAGHEIAHHSLDELRIVTTMHERKALMADLSDSFVMMPGGFGTYEEFMESVTWAYLGIHDKRCAILNVDHFFDQLLDFLGHAVESGFIKRSTLERVLVSDDVDALLDTIVGRSDQVEAR